MMQIRKLFFVCFVACGVLLGSGTAVAGVKCQGKFANPITDYCWSCMFPFSIGKNKILIQNQEDIPSVTSGGVVPVCNCGVKIGIMTGFWEPTRLVDVTRTPYCFVGLGGVTIDFGFRAPSHAQTARPTSKSSNAFYQVHWYTNPLLFWLEVLLDNSCLEKGVLDIAYITEIDPLWADSETSFIINPDVTLFSNVLAQAACAADCVAATAGFPQSELFWCAGCQGSMYPLNGWVGSRVGGVQASTLLTSRMTAKLHRELLMWSASGEDGLCGYYPQPMMDKRNYKFSMTYPIPQTEKIFGKCCQPFGRSSVIWGAGKEYPIKGEDYSYQIFRKRDCCAGSLLNLIGN